MPPLEIDPRLSVEGIFTALGVVIAVFGGIAGFLIATFKAFRSDQRERRERADRLTIMEILERDLLHGLTEAQIKGLFQSDETYSFRQKAGASSPGKLSDHDFSRYLRDLQWQHMVDQIEENKYRLRSGVLSYEQERARRAQLISELTKIVSENKLVSVLEKTLINSNPMTVWRR